VLHELAGRHFCVRYGEHRDIDICHEIGQSVMLDNGAFPAWTQGKATDWPGYYRFCEKWLEHWSTWAVIPDVIDGDEAANDALLQEWPFGDRGAPVWHMHESLDRLEYLVWTWPLVCIGSSGDYSTLGTPRWRARMAEAMDVACDERGVPRTRLHMLRGIAYAGGQYPFYSADSTNIARNHAGSHRQRPRSVRLHADEIDARQTPARWHRISLTEELTA
jgi:hypothetical protein